MVLELKYGPVTVHCEKIPFWTPHLLPRWDGGKLGSYKKHHLNIL